MAIWLNEADVRAVLPMPDLIDAMQTALTAFSSGGVRQPVRNVIETPPDANFFAAMPAYLEAGPAMGAKMVTVYHRNGDFGLPTHQAVIVLLDANNGSLRAVMDGRYITEARTAAVSAAAVRVLARQDAKTLAIIGSGVQAGSHMRALPLVREFQEMRCWSPTPARLEQFVAAHPGMRASTSVEDAVRGADVVIIATGSFTPVVWNDWVDDGTTVVSVGACRPTQREMDGRLVARGRVLVDSRAAALKESGDIVIPMNEGLFGAEHIAGELGEVLAGRTQGRTSQHEVLIFKPLGQAVEDVAAAQLAYSRACAEGRGAHLA